MSTGIYLILIFVMLLLSAFFSGSEIAFNASNKMRLKKAAESGEKTAKVAYDITEHFTSALCTILIGNNLVNIGASSISTVLIIRWLNATGLAHVGGLASLIATVVMTVIILIVGEIVPKILAKQHADRVVRVVAIPVRILNILLFPVVLIVLGLIRLLRHVWKRPGEEEEPTVTEEELSSIIDTVEEEGVIDEDKSELLQSTLEFPDTTVEEVMTPRIDTVFINLDEDMEQITEVINTSRFSRLPVYEDGIDNIIGLLYLNHYYKALVDDPEKTLSAEDLRGMLIHPCFLHKTMKLPAALNLLREKKVHLGIVIDEFGGTLGVVSMEDILEELVGDIWDENDEVVNEILQTGENTYDVNGDMNIDDFFAELEVQPADDFECEYSTVGGWAVQMLEADPHEGDSFVFGNLTVVVTEMDEMRVVKLTVLVTPEEKEEEE